jgi:hypothetical protein
MSQLAIIRVPTGERQGMEELGLLGGMRVPERGVTDVQESVVLLA